MIYHAYGGSYVEGGDLFAVGPAYSQYFYDALYDSKHIGDFNFWGREPVNNWETSHTDDGMTYRYPGTENPDSQTLDTVMYLLIKETTVDPTL